MESLKKRRWCTPFQIAVYNFFEIIDAKEKGKKGIKFYQSDRTGKLENSGCLLVNSDSRK